MKYLHLIYLDKFTENFIRFIAKNFKTEEHSFIVYGSDKQYIFSEHIVNNHIFFLENHRKISKRIRRLFCSSDLIIVNGLFGPQFCLAHFLPKILKKTYLMFWGGDFYCIRQNKSFSSTLSNLYRKFLIRNAKGVINLIPGDYEELCKLCNPKGIHFIAPMCGDGSQGEIIKSLLNIKKSKSPIKILLGNSATDTNQHIPALKMLERYKNEDIQIVCPLSYGEEEYRKHIIELGHALFDKKFYPLLDFMKLSDYYSIIADCSVAIFNNNRQQAMGNISAALALNCKVYIRNDTPMWKTYHDERNMLIYNIEDINNINFDEFVTQNPNQNENYSKYLEYTDVTYNIKAWQKVFNSIVKE